METQQENQKEKWMRVASPAVLLGTFILVVVLTAEVDWAAEHPAFGMTFRIGGLVMLSVTLGALPFVYWFLASRSSSPGLQSTRPKKNHVIAVVILFAVANSIPPVFYVGFGMTPGPFIYLQLGLMGLMPGVVPVIKDRKKGFFLLVILVSALVVPFAVLVNQAIDSIWLELSLGNDLREIDKTFYYMFFWGMMMPFSYLVAAIGWRQGGGRARHAWNLFMGAMLLQYSTMEDFLYFLLNGESLPGTWPWLRDFVINLEILFGRIPTDLDLLVFCIITSSIAIFILLDGYYRAWKWVARKTGKRGNVE